MPKLTDEQKLYIYDALITTLVESGADNYLSLTFSRDDGFEYEVLIQKLDGKTPAQKNIELEAEIEQLKRERDELKREVKGGLIVLDGLKRRIRDSFEFWPELAMFQDLSNLLNLKPSAVKLEAHNLEQQAKGLEDLYKEIEGGGSSSLMTFILKEEADNYANRQRGYD